MKQSNAEVTKLKTEKIKQFATVMPLNFPGTVLVWYYIKSEFDLHIDIAAAIDPMSVCRHFMLKVCFNDADLSSNLYWSLRTAIKQQAVMVEKETVDKHTIKDLKLAYHVMLKDLKQGGCEGYNSDTSSRCLYSNSGAYDFAAANQKLDIDVRKYVSPNWILTQLSDVSLDDYHAPENYMLYQPGIIKKGVDVTSEPKSKRRRPNTEITSLFELEGELTLAQQSGNDSSIERYMSLYQKNAEELTNEMSVLVQLHHICFDSCDVGTRLIRLGLAAQECIWCTLGISAGARRIFHDLMQMAKEELFALGINPGRENGHLMTGDQTVASKFQYGTANEREEENLKKIPTNHTIRKKGRPSKANFNKTSASKHSDALYSLDLDTCRVNEEPVNYIFPKWSKEKYPFIAEFLDKHDLINYKPEIRDHCSIDGNVFCICNVRRSFCDTDCYARNHHVCFLPFFIRVAQNLVELYGRSKCTCIILGRIPQLAAKHHMFPNMTQC